MCTANREWLFGDIEHGELSASPLGEIVLQEWEKSFEIRQELFCDAFVLMPNHLHAILRIDNPAAVVQTHDVQTHGRASLPRIAHRSPKSISSFMAGFKSSATKLINEYRKTPKQPVWQPRFHDHIIRNNAEYQRISDYIQNNPANWRNDRFHGQ